MTTRTYQMTKRNTRRSRRIARQTSALVSSGVCATTSISHIRTAFVA
jgi:hypothetical protein